MIELITEEWLRDVGFKWHQFDRQPSKHWLLWLGDCMGGVSSFEDIGIELAYGAFAGADRPCEWFCWLRSDAAGRYHRFIHVRHVSATRDVVRLFEGLTGQTWNPMNHYSGCARTAEQMRRITEENARRPDRQGKWPAWAEVERDDTRGRALPEHMQVAEDARVKRELPR